MIVELALALALAPARSAEVDAHVQRRRPDAALIVTGRVTVRRRDRVVLYLARHCEPTVARARRHYVVAYDARTQPGDSEFRAALARDIVRPSAGRACLLVADARGARKRQDSARYAL